LPWQECWAQSDEEDAELSAIRKSEEDEESGEEESQGGASFASKDF